MSRFQKFAHYIDLDFLLGLVYIAAWVAVFVAAGGAK